MVAFRSILLLAFFAILSPAPASALVTLGSTNQTYTLTGIGNNSAGEGQSHVTFGSCTYDGTTTTCILSGPFTGLGPGGTYTFTVSYPGNGAFPLNAVSQSPGSNQIVYQATSNYTFSIARAESSGPTVMFYSFANFNFEFSGATCTGVPAISCAVGLVGSTPGATISGQLTGTFDPTPNILPNGAITASNYGGFTSIAAGTWMEIYGVNLANTQSANWGALFSGNQAPTSVGGTTATVAGIPAYISYVSPGQIDILCAFRVPIGSQQIVITTAGGSSTPYAINVNSSEPGFLAPLSYILSGSQNIVAFFANTNTFVLPVSISGISTARAKPGDYLTFYGIGFGPVTPASPAGQLAQGLTELQQNLQITFAGVQANIAYRGLAPGYTGLYQINVVVPNVPANDNTPLAFTLNGVAGAQNMVIEIN